MFFPNRDSKTHQDKMKDRCRKIIESAQDHQMGRRFTTAQQPAVWCGFRKKLTALE